MAKSISLFKSSPRFFYVALVTQGTHRRVQRTAGIDAVIIVKVKWMLTFFLFSFLSSFFFSVPRAMWAAGMYGFRRVLPHSVPWQLHSARQCHSLRRLPALFPRRPLRGALPSGHVHIRGLALHHLRNVL